MTQNEIQAIAHRVLKTEGNALLEMANNLPSDFSAVVKKILSINGRVIVSGVGKSGHIGNKIAATLSSTGTPANFMHATEASHGDLGMVTSSDFFILISNSGETAELKDVVEHARRFGIPMAAISSKPVSTLMKAADYKLILSAAPEACSIGMAPTTSTTLTLALGDAIAVALMEQRDFKTENFAVFHPGGKLGSKLATVANFMRTVEEMAILKSNAEMQDVILRMTETGFGMAVLVDNKNKLYGVITDGDLRRNIKNLMNISPKDIASSKPVLIKQTDFISAALRKMETSKVYTILVVNDERPIGILRMHDLLNAGLA